MTTRQPGRKLTAILTDLEEGKVSVEEAEAEIKELTESNES